ncbi:MAG TPA: glycosyltransferase family 9 protein [Bacteroidales bacterium]|nr:glycosyltransferase family 9 protein [Bacteroidales bacterium]
MEGYQRIIISRTDSIGDVILTLPMAGLLKQVFPGVELVFLGRSYTRPVIDTCEHIDDFLDWDELAKMESSAAAEKIKEVKAGLIIHVFPRRTIAYLARKAGIPHRLGTTNRLYHWYTCNKLVRLSRRKSLLHEAQLNLRLIEKISGKKDITLREIPFLYGMVNTKPLATDLQGMLDNEKMNIILHPGSKGSAREWGTANFCRLTGLLPPEKCKIFISGTAEEGSLMRDSGIFDAPNVTDLTGRMTLSQLISFIGQCDVLVAASTGPLHIAAAMGIRAIGIYPPIRPMHPGRWAPLGIKAQYIVKDRECSDCRNESPCHCMEGISPEEVANLVC